MKEALSQKNFHRKMFCRNTNELSALSRERDELLSQNCSLTEELESCVTNSRLLEEKISQLQCDLNSQKAVIEQLSHTSDNTVRCKSNLFCF